LITSETDGSLYSAVFFIIKESFSIILIIIQNYKGHLLLNPFGFFGSIGEIFVPFGFNQWRETDGKMEIGKLTDMTDFNIQGADIVHKTMIPRGILKATPAGLMELLKKNWHGILQMFDIHVTVFNDRIEIRGLIPPQVIELPGKKQSESVPISPSVRD
jgi:hypothetical protein